VRHSRRGGEERGERMSVVELAGGEARFIGPGRRWGGGEAVGSGGVLIPIGFEGVKGEEEMGRRRIDGELEGDDPTLWFDFTQVREGHRHRHMAWRRGPKGGEGAAGNSQRWETSGENWPSGLRRLVGQMGLCEAFGTGEEGGCSGLRWVKRPDELGAMVGFVMKNQEKGKG
jgi:hypothetical protein